MCEKDYISNLVTCSCQNDKYLASIIDDFIETKTTCKAKNFLLAFMLFTIALYVAVSIYYWLIKYWAKQIYLLPCHHTNKLK